MVSEICIAKDLSHGLEDARREISPGKIGDGLFPPADDVARAKVTKRADEDEGLSSEEENLIAESAFAIRSLFKTGAGLDPPR